MNVNTNFGVFGKYSKTSYPDGSVSLQDPSNQRFVDVPKDQLPLSADKVEKLFADKYAS